MAKRKVVRYICDWCKEEKEINKVKFNGKKYDLCISCIDKIETRLNTNEKGEVNQ